MKNLAAVCLEATRHGKHFRATNNVNQLTSPSNKEASRSTRQAVGHRRRPRTVPRERGPSNDYCRRQAIQAADNKKHERHHNTHQRGSGGKKREVDTSDGYRTASETTISRGEINSASQISPLASLKSPDKSADQGFFNREASGFAYREGNHPRPYLRALISASHYVKLPVNPRRFITHRTARARQRGECVKRTKRES